MTETIQISPVPGLIAATPATRPSGAWTAWLEKWAGAKPDTRSPYWKAWSRHQSREVMRTRYAERPSRPRAKFEDMSGAQFAVAKVKIRVNEFASAFNARPQGVFISAEMRGELAAAVICRLVAKGLDCTRTHGEISVFVDRFIWVIAKRELADLVNTIHVTDYGMRQKKTANHIRVEDFIAISGGLDPLSRAILREEVGKLTDYQFEQALRKNKL